jgi:UDP-2,4-diacetamido-2,4,6-trideoxy-beta-L-altropyranose hydrolase
VAPDNRRLGRIVFRCDASNLMGGGHVMRCLTLAGALADAGAIVTFVAAAMPEPLIKRIADAGCDLKRVAASAEMERDASGWESPPQSAEAQLADASSTGAAVGEADWVVVDHYLLDATWHSAARGFAQRVAVIDDLANRSYDCDLLLDQTCGRLAEDYSGLVAGGTRILAGATYALLRPEFASERPAALDRRQAGGPVQRILVSMGTVDPDGTTAGIVEQLLAIAPECAVDAVTGTEPVGLNRLQELATRHPNLAIHVDTNRMAELMRDADLAVGAAGTTTWERCCLGLPTVAVVLADNQRLAADNLEQAAAVVRTDCLEAVPALVRGLLDDKELRLRMIAAAAAVTDGLGAERLAAAMTGTTHARDDELTLRPAEVADSRSVWTWRNDLTTRTLSRTTAPVTWPEHQAWWARAVASDDRKILIAEVANAPVAALRFDKLGPGEFEVSINLAPAARNSGVGSRVLAAACRSFREENGPVRLTATIHRDNPASRRVFEKLGFARDGARSAPVFERYVLAEGAN